MKDESPDIIIVTQGLLEPGTTRGGAVEEINFRIAGFLSKRYSVSIIGPFHKKYVSSENVNERLTINRIFFPAIRNYPPNSRKELYFAILFPMPIYLILMIIKILPLIKRESQVFVLHNGLPGLAASILAKVLGKKIIFFEGTLFPWINASLYGPANRSCFSIIDILNLRCGKLICKMSNSIVVQSSLINESMVSLGIDSKKIKVISGGVDTTEFSPKQRAIDSNQIFRIGFIGRLSEEKGASMLLDIIQKSEKKFPYARFLIMGEGPYKNKFRNFSNIEHLGWISKTDLPLWIAKTDVILFFQRDLGLAELEAMASEKAIIFCNLGETAKFITDLENGILCPLDSDSYIKKIDFLMKNPDVAKRISIGARNTAIRQFSWDRIAFEWANLCHKCLINDEEK